MQTRRIVWLLAPWLAGVAAALAPDVHAQEASRAVRADAADDKRWQAVAPGRVEPASGEIKIGASIVGVIGEVHGQGQRQGARRRAAHSSHRQ